MTSSPPSLVPTLGAAQTAEPARQVQPPFRELLCLPRAGLLQVHPASRLLDGLAGRAMEPPIASALELHLCSQQLVRQTMS